MVPIASKSEKDFDEEDFRKHILDVCSLHQKEGRALAFAFLVYDFSNHTINPILNDKNYWSTLDSIAGKYLSIFYIDSKDSYFDRRKREILAEKPCQRGGNFNEPPMLNYLIPVTPPPTPLEDTILFLRKAFAIKEQVTTPFIVFFQVIESMITDTFIVILKKDLIEDTFNEIKKVIGDAVDSLKNVSPENNKNYQDIFNLIQESIKNSKIRAVTKRVVKSFSVDLILYFLTKLAKSF